MKAQVSVTPGEAKRLIARAVVGLPPVREALKSGTILLKGGTTVSAVAEELASVKLTIAGRITALGAKSENGGAGRRIVIERGKVRNLESDTDVDKVALKIGKGDVLIVGANAIDASHRAAIMIGAPLGGLGGRFVPNIISRGVNTIVAVGWEKLIPCNIDEAIAAAGRETIDLAMGMAVGLVALSGTVVTETFAVSSLTGTRCTVIGAGGIGGGEGSTTFVIEGETAAVKKAWELVQGVKGAGTSGVPETLMECAAGCPGCATYVAIEDVRAPTHRACVYRQPGLERSAFSEKS